MKVQILSLVEGAREARGIAVMIDVFRSSNTMLAMFEAGVEKIIQVETVEEALNLKKKMPKAVLFGERDGFPPLGFDFGNSPVEAQGQDLSGKTAILCTSAGSAGIQAMKGADRILIGSFANMYSLVDTIRNLVPEIVSLCAIGKEGVENAAEDQFCAQYLESILNGGAPYYPSVKQLILRSSTAQRLRDRGQADDLEFCLWLDTYDVVPEVFWEDELAVVKVPDSNVDHRN